MTFSEPNMKSTVGRPRSLTDAQVEAILHWHATRKTIVDIAHEHGVSEQTIRYVIRRGGKFKQPSPEKRDEALAERHRVFAEWRRPERE